MISSAKVVQDNKIYLLQINTVFKNKLEHRLHRHRFIKSIQLGFNLFLLINRTMLHANYIEMQYLDIFTIKE